MLQAIPRQITSDADLWEAVTVHGAHFQHCRDRIEHQRLQFINQRNREAVRYIARRTLCS